jgi:hypothetical protein
MSPPPPPPAQPPSSPTPHHHIPMVRPIYHRGYYPGYRWNDDWGWRRPVYIISNKDDNKEDMNYLPMVLVGGIAIIALVVSLQKK